MAKNNTVEAKIGLNGFPNLLRDLTTCFVESRFTIFDGRTVVVIGWDEIDETIIVELDERQVEFLLSRVEIEDAYVKTIEDIYNW